MEHLIDRDVKLEHWGEGEWVDEPDYLEFEHMGIQCEINRVHAPDGPKGEYLFGGHLCGYVKLPSENFMTEDEINDLDVHGGITFNKNTSNGHWVGFDCAHCYDITPSTQSIKKSIAEKYAHLGMLWSSYRNFEYVKSEVESLAKQVAEYRKAP